MTKIENAREVVGGVDTHKSTHYAAVVDAATGKLLGDEEFPATAKGYQQLLVWMQRHGTVSVVGVEGTGSYGAGLQRFLQSNEIEVIEVNRPNRQTRRRQGKSDPIDAISAARAVLAGTATTVPKKRDGVVESVRLIRTSRRSAVKARRAAIAQIHAVLWGGPEDLRTQLADYDRAALVTRCAKLRISASAPATDPAVVAKRMLRRLARRVEMLDDEIADANEELDALLEQHAPTLLNVFGAGTEAAGQILTTAGENLDRLTSEAALARLCGVAPIPASSGTTDRHRLHRGGDRDANAAIYLIVITRLRWHQPTKDYVAKRTAQGKTKKDIIRCLKRAVVRELYRALRADLIPHKLLLDNA